MLKTCRDCGQAKPLDEFYKDSERKDGRISYCKPCSKARTKTFIYEKRTEVINLLGGKCVRCGETDRRVLQVNHLNGDGREVRYDRRGFVMSIVKGQRTLDDLDVRCANCNILYEYERGARIQWDNMILGQKHSSVSKEIA